MTKSDKILKSRVGTCRSGVQFEIPYNLDPESVPEYWCQFAIPDRVDIFCMCEARVVAIETSEIHFIDHASIRLLGEYIWFDETFSTLKPHLVELGLTTSPDYVRFGQLMLLG